MHNTFLLSSCSVVVPRVPHVHSSLLPASSLKSKHSTCGLLVEACEARCLLSNICIDAILFEPPFQNCIDNAAKIEHSALCCTFALNMGTWTNVTALSDAMVLQGKDPCCPGTHASVCALLADNPSDRLCDLYNKLGPNTRGMSDQIKTQLDKAETKLTEDKTLDPFIKRYIKQVLR